MSDFHIQLRNLRVKNNLDRNVVCEIAHINFQTITKIESGLLSEVKASDFVAYLRVIGLRMRPGKPRIKLKK